MDIDVRTAGKQGVELCCVEGLLFGRPVREIAAILSEAEFNRSVNAAKCIVQM